MTHDLDVLRTTRASVAPPSAATRGAARACWDTGTLAIIAPTAPRSRPHGTRAFATRALIAAAVAVALTAGVWIVTRERITSVKPKHTVSVGSLAEAAAHEPQVFLLVGSDSRAFATSERDVQSFGDPATLAGARSDTMVLVRLDPSSHRVMSVSIPRDLFVDVPGCGVQKINSAFDSQLACEGRHGGAQLLVETITRDLGVPINHVIEMHFPQFAALVDQLGGLRIAFPVPTRDGLTGLDEPAGCITLPGSQALAFVRSRHYEFHTAGQWQTDPTSDLGRMARQQLALRQLAAAAKARAGTDARPLLRALFDHIVVDSGFTADDALRYFAALRDDHATSALTLPTSASMVAGGQNGLVLAPGAKDVLDTLAGRSTPADAAGPPPTAIGSSFAPSAC